MSRLTRRQRIIIGCASVFIGLVLFGFFGTEQCSHWVGGRCYEYRADSATRLLYAFGIAVTAAVLLVIVPPGKRKSDSHQKTPSDPPSQPNVTAAIAQGRAAIDKMRFPTRYVCEPVDAEAKKAWNEEFQEAARRNIRAWIIGLIVGILTFLGNFVSPHPVIVAWLNGVAASVAGGVLVGLIIGFIVYFLARFG